MVNKHKVLPGVAYLEMAHTALNFALSDEIGPRQLPVMRLKNIVWARPIMLAETSDQIRVHTGLVPDKKGDLDYTVYSLSPAGEKKVHSQGQLLLNSVMGIPKGPAPVHNLETLRKECSNHSLSAAPNLSGL